MDFSEFDKCKAYWNSKDEKKLATTQIWITKYVSYDALFPTIVYMSNPL